MMPIGYFSGLVFLACLVSVLHRCYLSFLFEQEYYFSHLSQLEREISFKSEAGFYYSFYKTLVESRLSMGIEKLVNDNVTEYPDTINTLKRFNLYPEIIAALCYKSSMMVMSTLNLPTKICYKVNRGQGRGSVTSCEGIGEPVFVYLEAIFTLNGLMMGLIFLYGTYLSGNMFGGLLSVLSFFYNHGECTRVYLTPPLRESFGYPFWVLHSFITTYSLRSKECNPYLVTASISISTFLFLLPWQFSQFVLAVQSTIVFAIYIISGIEVTNLKSIVYGYLLGLVLAIILQFGNSMLLSSYFLCTCLASLCLTILKESFFKKQQLSRDCMFIIIFFGGVVIFKSLISFLFRIEDDSHIMDILRSKFSSFKSFHAMLYTCAPEFDFIDIQTFVEIFKTMLLPLTLFVALRMVRHIYFNFKDRKHDVITYLYMIMHLSVFFIMATTTMRLKLFLVPHMCLMVSMVTNTKPVVKYFNKVSLFVAIIALMSYKGIQNLRLQTSITGEFNDYATENMLLWISQNTVQDSVFGGSMSTMATIKLTTGRPIVNHPHYENSLLRARTKKVYTIFSRKTPVEVWKNVIDLEVNFVVLERAWCWGRSKMNCSLADIWDFEDFENRERPRICDLFYSNPKPYFQNVYQNSQYAILRVIKGQK